LYGEKKKALDINRWKFDTHSALDNCDS